MIERYGESAIEEIGRRVKHNREHGDHEAAELWDQVLRTVRRLQGRT
jgi:hypothetical protein